MAIGLDEDWFQFLGMVIHIGKPAFCRFLVVLTVDNPVTLEPQVVLKIEGQMIRRHDAPGEKVGAHPIIIASRFEKIW